MVGDPVLRRELEELTGRAKYVAAVASVLLLVSSFFLSVHWASFIGGVLVGLVAFVCAVVSWRWYHPWFSWLIWAVPAAAGFGVLVAWYGVNGQASIANLFGHSLWSSILVFFGLLWLLRQKVLRWVV